MAQGTVTDGTGFGVSNTKPGGVTAMRAAAVLTTSLVASSHMIVESNASGAVRVTCASVDYTSIQTLLQGSRDASAWFDIPERGATVIAAHSQTLANLASATDGAYLIPFSVAEGVLYVRCQIKRTGGTAVGTVAVDGWGGCAV